MWRYEKFFFARFARESRFVPLTFKIVAPPLHRDVGAYGNIKEYDTIRYDTRCYFNVRSKADMSQLNLPHRNNN